jgi:FMN-dependent NADH-azoreductase
LEVDVLPLWQTELPPFDGDKAAAKVNVILGQEQNAVQKTAWEQVVEIASRFISADRYLFAVPMWNGTIPYRLKHYIDIIHQPGLLFGLKPETGYFGLLENKHATLVLTSRRLCRQPPVAGLRGRPPIHLPQGLAQPGRRHRHRRGEIPAHAPDARSPGRV